MKELDISFYIDNGPSVTINKLVREKGLLSIEIGRHCTGSKRTLNNAGECIDSPRYVNNRFVLVFQDGFRLNVAKNITTYFKKQGYKIRYFNNYA
jgi:hypothetical protein